MSVKRSVLSATIELFDRDDTPWLRLTLADDAGEIEAATELDTHKIVFRFDSDEDEDDDDVEVAWSKDRPPAKLAN